MEHIPSVYVNLGIAMLIGVCRHKSIIYDKLVELPCVILHELCHWITALLLRGRPSNFTITPKKEKGLFNRNIIVLGSVTASFNQLNGGFIALAPLWLWVIAVKLIENNEIKDINYIILELIAGLLFKAGTVSTQDIYLSLKYPISSIVVVCTILIGISPLLNTVFN